MDPPAGRNLVRLLEHRRQKSGGSLEQYKHPCLVPDLEFSSKLFVEMAAIGAPSVAPTGVKDSRDIILLPEPPRDATRRAAG